MMLPANVLSSLLALFLTVEGVSAGATCTTITGYNKVYSVPTKTSTKCVTSTKKVTLTSTPTVTVTPAATTFTSTVTLTATKSTTAVALTTTIVVTSTESTIVTSEAPTSTVTASTITTSTATTTTTSLVPTSDGFLPVESTLPETDIELSFKKRDVQKAKWLGPLAPRNQDSNVKGLHPIGRRSHGLEKRGYPQSVACSVTQTKTSTTTVRTSAKAITTTKPALKVTVTVSVSQTITTTVVLPEVSTTVTSTVVTSTSTAFTTPSTTVTQTSTAVETATATSTAYAACQSGTGNLVYNINGFSLQDYMDSGAGTDGAFYSDQSNPYDCCAACQVSANCLGSIFVPSGDTGTCFFVESNSGVCTSPSQYQLGIGTTTTTQQGQSYNWLISNGVCGQFTSTFVDS